MASKYIFFGSFLFLLLVSLVLCSQKNQQIYVVNFGNHHDHVALHLMENTHRSYLRSVKKTDAEAEASHLYTYKHSFNGLAALLTPQEASKLSKMKGIVSVRESKRKKYSLHTTRSWDFMGLNMPLNPVVQSNNIETKDMLSTANYGEDVIVGIIDTGIWPESKSFSDEGMPPVPARWKGICQNGTAFNSSHCNRKIIGARYYIHGYQGVFGPVNETEDYKSARDKDGHGTHTASIIAGRTIPNVAGFGGFAGGKVSGGAPMARLAIYKACFAYKGHPFDQGNWCDEIDVAKAFDDAVGDGVNVISVSFGMDEAEEYAKDAIAMGGLRALEKKNVLVVVSGGNAGPSAQSVTNPAPWLFTVAASTIDRSFPANILLPNGSIIQGQSVSAVHMDNKNHKVVFASQVENPDVIASDSGYCLGNTLDPNKVKGNVVLCLQGRGDSVHKGLEVQRAGGVAFILANSPNEGKDIECDAHVIPSTSVALHDTERLIHYIRSSHNPMVRILPGSTSLNATPAPVMTFFSGRGPNPLDPNFIKPDITAPGREIVGAWTPDDGPTRMSDSDRRRTEYNIMAGTSVSAPHVAGAAALVKAINPTWSSAAIRSALMTTAGTTDNTGNPITDESGNPATPMAMGSGHLRPTEAANPGLVYNSSYTDYLLYLCHLGVTEDMNIPFKCPVSTPEPANLNYPSIQLHMLNGTKIITRTVTNVGSSHCNYTFISGAPKEYTLTASPDVLVFDHVGQELSFNITVQAVSWNLPTKYDPDFYYFGSYAWTNGQTVVRSPVAVSFP